MFHFAEVLGHVNHVSNPVFHLAPILKLVCGTLALCEMLPGLWLPGGLIRRPIDDRAQCFDLSDGGFFLALTQAGANQRRNDQ